jgi:CRP-like cAMP-binding protein
MSPKTSTYRDRLAVFPPSTEPEFESALEGMLQRKQFVPGECLFHEKNLSDGLYILREGKVGLEIAGADNGTVAVATCGPSMLIGAGAAVSGRAREYTARALTKVTTDFVSREVILTRMRACLPFALQISQLLAAEVARTNQLVLRMRMGEMPFKQIRN